MIKRTPFLRLSNLLGQLGTPVLGNPVASVIFSELKGVALNPIRVNDIAKPAFLAGVAAGAYMNIYGVTAGKIPRLCVFILSASVAARYSVEYNTVQIFTIHLPANTPIVVPIIPFGWFNSTTGGLFRMQNNGAGAADMCANLFLEEPV